MTVDSDPQHHSYMSEDYRSNRNFSQNEQNSYHQPDYHSQQQQQHHPQALMPGVSHYHIPTTSSKSTEASPQRVIMSSQPTTPQPSATSTGNVTAATGSPLTDQHESNNNTSYPSSPSVPLETQQPKYSNGTMVTPGTPSSYHTTTPTTPTRDRKESLIHETCPSFGPTEYAHNIVSMDRHTTIDVRLHTKVDRGFFLADNDWTCYRRNYFQVSGSFSLEGVGMLYEGQDFPCLAKDHNGQLEEIHCFMLGVSARLSDCDKAIQLIQHTPKRDKGPQTTPVPKLIRPGGNIGFSAVGSSQSIVTFERLQFKTATANNGKRRAAQQYYVIVVELLAKLRNGHMVTVASARSSNLVVRGRSPGHYAETDSGGANVGSTRQQQSRNNSNGGGGGPTSSVIQQQHHHNSHVPYGRPTAYAGASANLFQPTEYMPYDYHGVAYTNYGHMPPPPPPPMSHPHPYPGTPPVPVMQQQQHYSSVHDRQHSNTSNTSSHGATEVVPTAAYPSSSNNNSTNNNEPQQTQQQQQTEYTSIKEESHTSSPYYWQRHDGRHEDQQQENWNRMRMASNHSTPSMDHSQHGSPYLNHPPPQQQTQQQQAQEHAYYSHPPPPQAQYAHHPAYSNNNNHHHPLTQSLPPPSVNGPDHYYQQQPQHYDWQPRSNTKLSMYTYESDSRRQDYDRQQQQHHQQQQSQQQEHQSSSSSSPSTMANREATIVK